MDVSTFWLFAAAFLFGRHNYIEARCAFPGEWWGHWFLGGVGEVTINEDIISTKGTCIQTRGEFYLMQSRDGKCFQCLQVLPRNRNIIQYRESFCMGYDSMENICDVIHEQVILNTLIREPVTLSPCPLEDAYHFSYNNNSAGYCRDPLSYATPCAGGARYRLQFKRCPMLAYSSHTDAYNLPATELSLECVGNWTSNGKSYMVARLVGPTSTKNDDTYRCIVYLRLGTVVYMAFSGDATCRGIRSPRDGPMVLEMTRDLFGWPQPTCEFPSWFTDSKWRDLSGSHIVYANEGGMSMEMLTTARSRREIVNTSTFRCVRLFNTNTTARRVVVMSFTMHGCEKTLQCLRIEKRHTQVIELHIGRRKASAQEACLMDDFGRDTEYLMIPTYITPTPCPYHGKFTIADSDVCSGEFLSGCGAPSDIQILSRCVQIPAVHLECLHTWTEGRKQFLIARKNKDFSGAANCFSFRLKDESVVFRTDKKCNIGTKDLYEEDLKYRMHIDSDDCPSSKGRLGAQQDKNSNTERTGRAEGHDIVDIPYKHVEGSYMSAAVSHLNQHNIQLLRTLIASLIVLHIYSRCSLL